MILMILMILMMLMILMILISSPFGKDAFNSTTSPPPPAEFNMPHAYDSNDDLDSKDLETLPNATDPDAKKEEEEKMTSPMDAIRNDLLKKAQSINASISGSLTDAVPAFLHRKKSSSKDDPFADGESSTVVAVQKEKEKEKDKQNLFPPGNEVYGSFKQPLSSRYPPSLPSISRLHHLGMSGGYYPMDDIPITQGDFGRNNPMEYNGVEYNDEMFILYRSKEKMMISTHEVYDVGE